MVYADAKANQDATRPQSECKILRRKQSYTKEDKVGT